MTDSNDFLKPSRSGPRQGGMTPLDLMNLPNEQRKVMNWLSRAKRATMDEILAGVAQDADITRRIVGEMVQSGSINESLVGDQVFYRVVFKGTIRRGPVGLPREIWSRVDLDHMTFLRELSLFRDLTNEQLKDVANHLSERRYQRDEVIIWQGNTNELLYIIKSGTIGITRVSPQTAERKMLAYLQQGDLLGEYGAVSEGSTVASATATALTVVDVLYIKRTEFMDLMRKYAVIPLELSRTLVRRLVAQNTALTSTSGARRLVLIIGTGSHCGVTTVGNAMAMTLNRATQRRTVYTEQPEPHRLAPVFGAAPGMQSITLPDRHDVALAGPSTGLPAPVRATLAWEDLIGRYDNVIIGLSAASTEIITYLVTYANQIIVVVGPDPDSINQLNAVATLLKPLLRPEKTGVFNVLNRTRADQSDVSVQGRFDFELPYDSGMVAVKDQILDNLPEPLAHMAAALADRLGRTNQVSIFIPTTVDVNLVVDTSKYVEKTLAFLGERFGGATTNQARGVWNSADQGLVGEDIHIVRSYATQADLDHYMQEILNYVEQMKQELRQEAMAVEINQKLMLI